MKQLAKYFKENPMSKKKAKIELYAEAPYMQGYAAGKAEEEFFNPYAEIENAEADAEDYARGYENAAEEQPVE
jgi:hypothetical protein